MSAAGSMTPAKGRFAARAAWLSWWDVARPADGPVAVAMPLYAMTEGIPQRDGETVFALPGPQRVTWLGYDPARGLVSAAAGWDPARVPRPLPPALGWKPCDPVLFTAGGPWLPEHGAVRPGHRYGSLPMPSDVAGRSGLDRNAVREVFQGVKDVPIGRFVDATGLSRLTLSLALGAYLPRVKVETALPRSRMVMKAVSWLLGSDPADGVDAATARHRRCQAIEAMPGFAPRIMGPGTTALVVDPALELAPALAEWSGCGAGTVRVLGAASAGVDEDVLWTMQKAFREPSLTRMLDAVPRPVLSDLMKAVGEPGLEALDAMASRLESLGPPQALVHVGAGLRPGPDGGWGWLTGQERNWRHLEDVAKELSRDLLWPVQAAAEIRDGASPSRQDDRHLSAAVGILASLGAARLGRVLAAHMDGSLRRAAEVRSGIEDGPAYWPVPAEPVTASSGQTVRFLGSAAELAHEGERMRHCVGDYADACLEGRCAIMSVGDWTDGEWEPSSTVELRRRDGDGDLEVVQHQGRSNDAPPAGDVRVVEEWIAGLETGETLFDHDALPAAGRTSTVADVLGTSWDSPEAHAARWDRWRRILDVRDRSAGDFLTRAVSRLVRDEDATWQAVYLRVLADGARLQDAGWTPDGGMRP